MVVFPWGWYGEGAPVHRFIVQNNGTFITYTGISIHGNAARSDIIMWPFLRSRARIVLSDEDFSTISNMVSEVLENYHTPWMVFFGGGEFVLLHGGNIYEDDIWEIRVLSNELSRLSPLITEYNDPCVLTRLRMEQDGRGD